MARHKAAARALSDDDSAKGFKTMKPFKKHVCPGKVKVWPRRGETQILTKVYVTIELREAKQDRPPELSITSVEGPLSNGDCLGGCGQSNTLDVNKYSEGWDKQKVDKLRTIWERWHLNNMNAADYAMRRDGWVEQAKQEMRGYEFKLSSQARTEERAAKARATECLKTGETFKPTKAETGAATRPYSVTIWTKEGESEPAPPSEHYERAKHITGHNRGDVKGPEHKTLGWLKPSEHPDGLLGKIHPDSGNGYGSAWYNEQVPDDVLQWLLELPEDNSAPSTWQ